MKCRLDKEASLDGGGREKLVAEALKAGNCRAALQLLNGDEQVLLRVGPKGYTALHFACQYGNMDVIQTILSSCSVAALETTFRTYPSPADVAGEHGHVELEKFLREMFPLPSTASEAAPVDQGGHSSEFKGFDKGDGFILHQACSSGDLKAVKANLSGKKAEVEKLDGNGHTPLHMAAQGGHLEIVNLLVSEHNFSCGAQDADGLTPLHHAAARGHLEVVQ